MLGLLHFLGIRSFVLEVHDRPGFGHDENPDFAGRHVVSLIVPIRIEFPNDHEPVGRLISLADEDDGAVRHDFAVATHRTTDGSPFFLGRRRYLLLAASGDSGQG
jgi:hypothetical protein